MDAAFNQSMHHPSHNFSSASEVPNSLAFFTASKKGRRPPFHDHPSSKPRCSQLFKQRHLSQLYDKDDTPRSFAGHQSTAKSTPFQNTDNKQPRAAFPSTMSEPQPVDFDRHIDWSKGDLLDACYDSMNMDMGHESPYSIARASPGMGPCSKSCRECGESFGSNYGLNIHSKYTGHLAWECSLDGCNQLFPTLNERDAHRTKPHVLGHRQIQTSGPYNCIECEESYGSKADLLRHARQQQHQPYGCECGSLFSRIDVLNRHLEAFGEGEPKYPCLKCRRHRGADGFRRRDHLMQHMRNYHHEISGQDGANDASSRLKYMFPICPHPECPKYRDETFKTLSRRIQQKNKPFSTQSAYTKHLRDEHNESAFPCDIAGCDRVGRRGYFREKDLLKHRRDQHEGAPPYQVTQRELRIQCTEPGCNATLDPSSMKYHMGFVHRIWN